MHIETARSPAKSRTTGAGYRRQTALPSAKQRVDQELPFSATPPRMPSSLSPIRIYAYGVARNRLRNAIKRLRVPGRMVNDIGEAEALVTTRSYYRKRMKVIEDAERRGLPIYVLRSNTIPQMENFLSDLFDLQIAAADPQLENAMQEAQEAIQAVLNGTRSVDLKPASSYIRRLQHQTARQANLTSHSYGKEPRRRVRIYRD